MAGPAGPRPGGAGRVPALLTLLLGIWVAISPTALAYPLTPRCRDSAIWSSYLALLIGVLAVARLRAPRQTIRSAIALVVGSALMVALPFPISARPDAEVRTIWWNLLVSGALMLVLSVAGRARLAAARRHDRSRAAE